MTETAETAKAEAERIYDRLLKEKLADKQLLDDFQRTLLLIDPMSRQTNNLIYNYHWYVSQQLETRSESTLMRALKIADEK